MATCKNYKYFLVQAYRESLGFVRKSAGVMGVAPALQFTGTGGPMDTSDKRALPPTPASTSFALGLLTAIVYVAGFAMVAAWFALLMIGQPSSAQTERTPATCSVCGVVERV